jgi:hypothetical protein
MEKYLQKYLGIIIKSCYNSIAVSRLFVFLNYFPLAVSCNINTKDRDHDGFDSSIDCNDQDPEIHPDAEEVCDKIDNDCDQLIDDEDVVSNTVENVLYPDNDNDNYGDNNNGIGYCEQKPNIDGYIETAGDCDDQEPSINPSAQEICDEIDNDCDNNIDDNDSSLDISTGSTFYIDNDDDGYGTSEHTIVACTRPKHYSENNNDCDDTMFNRSPGEQEICNDHFDNDCDDLIDRDDPNCISQEPLNINTTFLGTQVGSEAGYSVASAGDINSDQWPDLLIGSPGVGYDTGEVYLYVSYPQITSGSLYDATHVFRGAHSFSRAGSAVGLAGDVDGDQRSDILIGADHTGLHEGLEKAYGAAYLFNGIHILSSIPRGLDEADVHIRGSEGDYFGANVMGTGDVNGDGLDDYMISAPYKGVHLFYGSQPYANSSDAPILFKLNPTTEEKHELAKLGDINGDGLADIFIGSPENRGDAHIFSGGLPNGEYSPELASISFTPERVGDKAHQIATVGDLDEDGQMDIMIGAPYNDNNGINSGKTYLFLAESLPNSGTVPLQDAKYQFHGQNSGDLAGYIYNSGDLNNDNKSDLLIGAPGYSNQYNNQGKIYTILIDSLETMHNQSIEGAASQYIEGTTFDLELGKRVSYVGDIKRMNKPAILVGTPNTDGFRNDMGSAHLMSLQLEECTNCKETCDDGIDNDNNDFIDCMDPQCASDNNCNEASETCDDGIDNDGDGGIDCVDPDCKHNPICPLETPVNLIGEHAYARAGWAIETAGDIDGDGLDDVLIGAPNRSEGHGNNGKIYLMFGESLLNTNTISLQSADFHFLGEEDGDLAGWSLSSAGDIDGDGLGDIIIGAPFNDANGENSGKVYVFLGATLQNGSYAIPINLADYILIGDHEFAYLGKDLDGDFDINGDGNNDIVLSSMSYTQWDQPLAKAHVVQLNLLSPGSYIISDVSRQLVSDPLSSDELLHNSYVTAVGDMDGDGLDDIALGTRGTIYPYFECGGVYVAYASSINGVVDIEPDVHIFGDEEGYRIGYVHSAGDIDNDGLDDLLIGQESETEIKSYIYNSNRFGIGSDGALHADYTFDTTGERFSVLSDIDGDGRNDYLFHGSEHLYLVYGSQFPHYGNIDFSWSESAYTFENKGGPFGSFGNAGDINGDGLNDIFLVNLLFNEEQGLVQWVLF